MAKVSRDIYMKTFVYVDLCGLRRMVLFRFPRRYKRYGSKLLLSEASCQLSFFPTLDVFFASSFFSPSPFCVFHSFSLVSCSFFFARRCNSSTESFFFYSLFAALLIAAFCFRVRGKASSSSTVPSRLRMREPALPFAFPPHPRDSFADNTFIFNFSPLKFIEKMENILAIVELFSAFFFVDMKSHSRRSYSVFSSSGNIEAQTHWSILTRINSRALCSHTQTHSPGYRARLEKYFVYLFRRRVSRSYTCARHLASLILFSSKAWPTRSIPCLTFSLSKLFSSSLIFCILFRRLRGPRFPKISRVLRIEIAQVSHTILRREELNERRKKRLANVYNLYVKIQMTRNQKSAFFFASYLYRCVPKSWVTLRPSRNGKKKGYRIFGVVEKFGRNSRDRENELKFYTWSNDSSRERSSNAPAQAKDDCKSLVL